ncbi:MAG: class I SAM-dependent DNA methyltransferase, partial [Deferrisomatales bacterium]
MLAARGQAEQYAKALPSDEGWPPFLVVVDVGHVVELFSDFTGTGKRYLPFPDALTVRLRLAALEHLKRLEDEVLNALHELGESQLGLDLTGLTVDPHQFLGIEVNPRAAAIADVVLWIGSLQWHFRTRGRVMPPEPVLRVFHNIECRDAVLEWDGTEPVRDEAGNPVTRWDGETTKPHPVTGQPVPDETARVPVVRYVNPRKATWPEADFIVGNPPFIGNSRMRQALGDGYTEALRRVHADVPDSVDFVLYWWNQAAELTRAGALRRFGLITTNSLRQVFARRVLARHLEAPEPLSLVFAIPDHPWVDSADGADVRIAMTVAEAGARAGTLREVLKESSGDSGESAVSLSERNGNIAHSLTIGGDFDAALTLRSNEGLATRGVALHGAGFLVTPGEAHQLGLGRLTGLEDHIRPYLNGRDLNQRPRGVMVIDLHGLAAEDVRDRYPAVYQWVHDRVKPERDLNREPYRRDKWWLFGRKNTELRTALTGLSRYIATTETSKHRFFVFLDGGVCPDNMLVNVALDDAYFLGVLSSRVHITWALAAGARLGVGNDPRYTKSRCFDPFPFPTPTEPQKARIRDLAERLDAHRKRQLAHHEGLTLTNMYNVLARLRSGEELTAAERAIHEQGLVSVLRELHDALDAAVFDAYGWPATLSDEQILERLVALNAERAAEEKRGLVRWLRPEYQKPGGVPPPPSPLPRGEGEMIVPLAGEGQGEGKGAAPHPEAPSPQPSPSNPTPFLESPLPPGE